MPDIKRVEGTVDGEDVWVEVSSGTALTSFKRALYSNRAQSELEELEISGSITVVAMTLLARNTYPRLLGAVIAAEGINVEDMTVAEFLDLPETFSDLWWLAVRDLCPHWFPAPVTDEDAEKKDDPSSNEESELS